MNSVYSYLPTVQLPAALQRPGLDPFPLPRVFAEPGPNVKYRSTIPGRSWSLLADSRFPPARLRAIRHLFRFAPPRFPRLARFTTARRGPDHQPRLWVEEGIVGCGVRERVRRDRR